MLIASKRYTRADLDAWSRTEDAARAVASTAVHRKRVGKSLAALLSFAGAGSCYAGVSWGKDSVVIAHMVATMVPRVPLVWVRVEPIKNPDCALVRDAFIARFGGVVYDEIESPAALGDDGEWHASGTLEHGLRLAAERYGARHISGVRGEESGAREMRMRTFGTSTARTCAPIGWLTALDVFAYLVTHDLPIHPAYACTMNGTLDPRTLRVASLGGQRGRGWGRAEWEERYYGSEVRQIESLRT